MSCLDSNRHEHSWPLLHLPVQELIANGKFAARRLPARKTAIFSAMRFLFAASVLVVACGPLRQLRRAPSPAPTAAVAPARPIPYPVFETKAFSRAVARGTRTLTGEPGPNYWQQFARYRIDAELVPSTSQITGRESFATSTGRPTRSARFGCS